MIKYQHLIIIAILFLPPTSLAQEPNDDTLAAMRYYVWDFNSPTLHAPELLKGFTEAFEEALIQTRLGTPLQRRQYAVLMQHKQNEKRVTSINAIPQPALINLSALSANTVVFGEVIDDKESGQLKIAVSFEAFDSRILAKDSVLLQRGKRFDAQSRQDAMDDLVTRLFPATKETRIDNSQLNEHAFFENDSLFISVSSFSMHKNEKQITLSLNVVNLLNENLYLCFWTNRNNIALVGNDGTFVIAADVSGISNETAANTSLKNPRNYTKLPKGRKTTVNLLFKYKENSTATTFDFSSEMAIYDETGVIPFSVGISGIQLSELKSVSQN